MMPMPLPRWTLALTLLLMATAAWAAAPRTIPVQGRITSPSGVPVTGTQNLTFRLYRSPTEATALWTETESVPVQAGEFHAILGDGAPFPASMTFAEPYYLGISVAGDAEMTPRLPLASVPYALALPNVTVAPGGNVGIGTVAPGSPLTVAGAVESTGTGFRFPDGTLQATAADAQRFARASHVAGFVSGLNTSAYRLEIIIDGQASKPAATMAAPHTVRLERIRHQVVGPDGIAVVRYVPGRLKRDSLVLRRPVSSNRAWAEWHQSVVDGQPSRHDVEIRLMQGDTEMSRWTAQEGWVSRYRLRLADDGLPVEEIALEFDLGKHLRRSPSLSFKATPPTAGAQAGFSSGQNPVDSDYRITLDGSVVKGAVIVADAGPKTDVIEHRVISGMEDVFRYIPGSTDPGLVTVRQNPGAGTEMHEWFERVTQGDMSFRPDLSLDPSPEFTGMIRMMNVWPSSVTLRLADDGLPVEDFDFVGESP